MERLPRRSASLFLSASLVVGAFASATAQSESALDAALAAVGGADALAALDGYVIEASGTRSALDEGPTPGGPTGFGGAFTSTTTSDLASGSHRIDYALEATEAGGARDVSEIVSGGVGYLDGAWAYVAPPGQVPMLPDRVVSTVTHQQLLNPHLLLREALADPTVASGDGDELEVDHGPTPITLVLADGVIAEARTMENDPLRRDVELVVGYDQWTQTDAGVSFPQEVTISYDGAVVHEESRTVATDPAVDPSRFAIPEGMAVPDDPDLAERGDLSHQYIQNFSAIGFPRDGLQLTVEATEVVPGVFHLAGGTHHSMAVVQDDGVIVVEAPIDETRSAAILEWIAAEQPDLPVTHVVQSHHHVDHSGGLRSLAGASGATVVAGAAAVPFYEREAFTAPSTIVPDGIDGSTIETLAVGTEPVVIGAGDGANPVTVVAFPNAHADDYVLVEAGGALWVVDIFNPGFGAPVPEAIIDFVEGVGLDVSVIVGGHGTSEPWPEADAA